MTKEMQNLALAPVGNPNLHPGCKRVADVVG